MKFYRLIKPDWGKPVLSNGEPNPKFIEEIPGFDVIEQADIPDSDLKALNDMGYNIYFFPNHPFENVYQTKNVVFLSGKHIDVFNYIFLDMDLKDGIYKSKQEFLDILSKFELKPTFTVDSGNGIHAYWRIKDLSRDIYVFAQLGLINLFKTDESVFTVLQLMRLPGFNNTKRHQDYVMASIIEDLSSNEEYSIEQLPQTIFSLPEELERKGVNHLAKLDGKMKVDLPQSVNIDELPDSFIDFIHEPGNSNVKDLFVDPKGSYGDRSGADMKLCNILYKHNFSRKEALSVIANSQKALEKGSSRLSYAECTVDKIYINNLNERFQTVGQKLRTNNMKPLADPVYGPAIFDYGILGNPWRKKELLGLIGGTGIGKTTVTLKIMKDMIENNKENDDIFVFFSLEMTEEEIIHRWIKLIGDVKSPLADRLYVISKEDSDGNPRQIGLQEMLEHCEYLKKHTGKEIKCIAIDHINVISRHIDTRKKYTFSILSEANAGWADVRTLGIGTLATELKTLAKMLNTFMIVLTQTTKEKAKGDNPISKDGAYGISQYENIMDRIITIWQPLMRVQDQTDIRFLAWQYVKIRAKHENDKIQTDVPQLLTFDIVTGELDLATPEQYEVFKQLAPIAQQKREELAKNKSLTYSIMNPAFLKNIVNVVSNVNKLE